MSDCSTIVARTDQLAGSVQELQALGEVSQAVNSTLDPRQCVRHHRRPGGAATRHRRGSDLCVRRGAQGVSPARHLRHERDHGITAIAEASTSVQAMQLLGRPQLGVSRSRSPTFATNRPRRSTRSSCARAIIVLLDHSAAPSRPPSVGALVRSGARRRVSSQIPPSICCDLAANRWWRSRMRACSRAWKPVRATWRNRWRIWKPHRPPCANPETRLTRSVDRRYCAWIKTTRTWWRRMISGPSRSNSLTSCGRRLEARTLDSKLRGDQRDR